MALVNFEMRALDLPELKSAEEFRFEVDRVRYLRLALAVAEAMREPTAHMAARGNEEADTCLKVDPCGNAGAHVWKTMIDAALEEGS